MNIKLHSRFSLRFFPSALKSGSVSSRKARTIHRSSRWDSKIPLFANIRQVERPSRSAFTLVELLTVLGIATLLAALILPSVKGLLNDRKTSQSAIMVKNYIEAARARAIGKNRSVAVVLERLSGRAADVNNDGIINMLDTDSTLTPPRFISATASSFSTASRSTQAPDTNFLAYNSCIKLSMAEEPLPVTERSVPVPFTITARSPLTPGPPGSPSIPAVYDPLIPLVDSDQVSSGINEVRVFQVSGDVGTNAAALLGEYLIAGNEVSFGKSPIRYTIVSPSTRAPHDNYASAVDAKTIWFSVLNERGLDGLGEMSASPYINIQAGEAWPEFRIFQKPKTIYTQTIQLPKGTCIDLSLSGFANDRSTTLSDYRVRFASDWVISGTAGVPRPDELRPIYLVFSANGALSRVYANQKATASTVSPQSVRIDAVEDLFLHVGRIDQVHMPVDPTLLGRNRSAMELAEANGTKQNLTDPSSYILRLSAKSGAITAAPINRFLPETTDTLFDIVGKSRLGTYNSTITGQ